MGSGETVSCFETIWVRIFTNSQLPQRNSISQVHCLANLHSVRDISISSLKRRFSASRTISAILCLNIPVPVLASWVRRARCLFGSRGSRAYIFTRRPRRVIHDLIRRLYSAMRWSQSYIIRACAWKLEHLSASLVFLRTKHFRLRSTVVLCNSLATQELTSIIFDLISDGVDRWVYIDEEWLNLQQWKLHQSP